MMHISPQTSIRTARIRVSPTKPTVSFHSQHCSRGLGLPVIRRFWNRRRRNRR